GEETPPPDAEHRADREEAAEPDVLAKAPVEHRGAQCAALTDEADGARPRHRRRKRGVEAGDRAHDAEAVRADEAHRPAAGFLEDLLLQRRAGLARLLEAGRD